MTRADVSDIAAGVGAGTLAVTAIATVLWFRRLYEEMCDDRGTIGYLGELHFATNDRERAWAEARRPPVKKARPDPVHWRFTGGE